MDVSAKSDRRGFISLRTVLVQIESVKQRNVLRRVPSWQSLTGPVRSIASIRIRTLAVAKG